VNLLLWGALALLQGGAPSATAMVDRTRVSTGDQLTLTVRARTRSAAPITLVLPALTGFAIVGSREVTEVTIGGAGSPVRMTTRELELRAERPGALVIGPVRIRQGGREVATAPFTVTVDSAATALTTRLSPIARSLIEAAPPPARTDRVALTVIIPSDSVLVGEQLDVIATAWFPRELHNRLRHAPILTMQTPEGVWGYPGAAPSDVAASRLVRGQWMDLFVAHQAVFPLAAGRVFVPPATVEYAVPATFSIFSREERYSLRSDSVPVVVLALPDGGRPAGDQKVVAQGLHVDVLVEPTEGRVGEPIDVAASLSGVGNVALWPEPVIHWPAGFRAYAGETGMRVTPRDGRIAGTKTFHYLVVPDSVGSFVLPEVRYPYYDLVAGAYVAGTGAPRTVAVAAGTEPRAARALPALAVGGTEAWTSELARDLWPWGWLALLVGAPLVAWLWRRREEPERGEAAAPVLARTTRLGRLERAFHTALASQVPNAEAVDGDGLARALRASGIERAVADHVMRLRDRLRAVRYGPHGPGDAAELAAELEQVLHVLGADPAGQRRRAGVAVGLLLLVVLPAAGHAQAPRAEALYEAGALRAAADSFAARAAAEPRVAAHWYNLGATLYRAGADGKATIAWLAAARLAPRDQNIARTRALLPPPDQASEALLASGFATPAEWALAAGFAWICFWVAVATRRERGVLLTLALLSAAPAVLALREHMRRTVPLAVVVNPGTSVRVAPFGGASLASTLGAGATLLIERRYAGWVEVRRSDGVHGWVEATDVIRP
jgi:oxygen tolerance protein BatD